MVAAHRRRTGRDDAVDYLLAAQVDPGAHQVIDNIVGFALVRGDSDRVDPRRGITPVQYRRRYRRLHGCTQIPLRILTKTEEHPAVVRSSATCVCFECLT